MNRLAHALHRRRFPAAAGWSRRAAEGAKSCLQSLAGGAAGAGSHPLPWCGWSPLVRRAGGLVAGVSAGRPASSQSRALAGSRGDGLLIPCTPVIRHMNGTLQAELDPRFFSSALRIQPPKPASGLRLGLCSSARRLRQLSLSAACRSQVFSKPHTARVLLLCSAITSEDRNRVPRLTKG